MLIRKLCESKGETIIEVLAAILVASLSVALLFSCVRVSVNLNKSSGIADASFYQGISKAEITPSAPLPAGPPTGEVSVKDPVTGGVWTTFNIYFHGDSRMYSYKEAP